MKRLITAGLMVLTLGLVTEGQAYAHAEIPTRVVGPVNHPEYPDPICTTCVVQTTLTANSSTEAALVDVVYLEAEAFEGEILVTVLLDNGARDELIISEVELEFQDFGRYKLPPGIGWSWDAVESVWLEFVAIESSASAGT